MSIQQYIFFVALACALGIIFQPWVGWFCTLGVIFVYWKTNGVI